MAAPVPEGSPLKVADEATSQAMQFGKKSFVKAVQQKHVLMSHDVKVEDVDGTQTVEIPDDLLVNTVPLWEDFLEGRFLDPAPHVAKIHILVNKIWPLGNKNVKIDVYAVNERTVKFRICDQQTRIRVLRRGVWNIAGIPMILSKWAPLTEKENEETEVKIVPMWVTMKNVPYSMYSWKGLGFIASSIGKPVRLHPETELCSNFEEAKVFVNANMTKPLPSGYRFRSKSGINADVKFTYPWNPIKCSLCAKWGHKDKECSKKIMNETEEGTEQGKEREPQREKTVERLCRPKVVEEVETISEAVTGREVEKQIDKSVEDEEPTVGKSGSCELQGGLRDKANYEVDVSMETEKDWSNVSPGKVGRSVEKHDAQTVISPSRFQLLAEADDDDDDAQSTTQESVVKDGNLSTGNLVDDAEEGEILQHDGENLQPKKDGKVSKPARPARVTLRVSSQSAVSRNIKPNGTSRKRSSKNH